MILILCSFFEEDKSGHVREEVDHFAIMLNVS